MYNMRAGGAAVTLSAPHQREGIPCHHMVTTTSSILIINYNISRTLTRGQTRQMMMRMVIVTIIIVTMLIDNNIITGAAAAA
jgi:hypothetical protein